MTIIAGLVVSKIKPNWYKSKNNPVNIPELKLFVKYYVSNTLKNLKQQNKVLFLLQVVYDVNMESYYEEKYYCHDVK